MNQFQINEGHVLDALKDMESESAHCVVTSPPYFGLRAYGTDAQVWGGDPNCEHEFEESRQYQDSPIRSGAEGVGFHDAVTTKSQRWKIHGACGACGAWRGEIGLEPTPDLYIQHMVEVFREVRRVMRDDALLWVNIGDSYASVAGGYDTTGSRGTSAKISSKTQAAVVSHKGRKPSAGLKPGDLTGIPWALATALRADGWYLRRDIIWHKIAPMPESVYGTRWEKHRIKTKNGDWPGRYGGSAGVPDLEYREGPEYADCPGCAKCEKNDGLILRRGSGRCTTAHEYVFMFSKTADYFYDTDAIAESQADYERERRLREASQGTTSTEYELKRDGADIGQNGFGKTSAVRGNKRRQELAVTGKRNKRSVWSLSPQSYSEDHFAAFPEDLPEICIKASTSERGCCADCGAPYARILARTAMEINRSDRREKMGQPAGTAASGTMTAPPTSTTLGWRRTCECETTEIIPATVLDPFTGRGTTGVVALRLARSFKGIELKPQYVEMIRKNITNDSPLFNVER